MCGIIGYIGVKKATPILIDGLLKLEYRGYDSSGISTIEKDCISIMKDTGRVKNLYNLDGINNLNGNIGIAHTRWATHGKPSKENSHPHLDNNNNFSVVHNGIIENYTELRDFLIRNGYTFYSQTDTEVIPNLIDYYYKKETIDDKYRILRALQKTCNDLKGSFAIQVISKFMPDNLIVIRKDSPIVIGKGDNENYVSSDIPAIVSYTKEFYFLNNYELALLSRDNIEFYDINLNSIVKQVNVVDLDADSADKNGFSHYMLKEIFEQPSAIRKTIGSRLSANDSCNFEELNFTKEFLSSINKIYIVACGTAMHAGLTGKVAIEQLCNIPVTVDIASEFRYRNPIIDKNTLCIYISQSGETADTIAALKLSKSKGATTLAISNVIESSITREADYSIYTHAGAEIAVASTKAYTSQVILLNILALYFAEILESISSLETMKLKEEILALPQKVEETLQCTNLVEKYSKEICHEKDIFFLGRGIDYTTALEGSLKLKEISYIHSDAYAAGELKHGPIALIEDNVTVVGIITDESLVEKTISNIQEVVTRGAKTCIITNQSLNNIDFNQVISVPKTCTLLSPIVSIIPLQLLAYYISNEKGLDVDKPRNLAKSVTVE
ncbi:MAG: glutamine--fructose-6-phosphate transaminase (isomerizing) [Clostridia bacterium]|nr:glutamine--fructose-6-phosphate transaminase (isomerizing) [Clostridia bacterium]